ncbi:hypothetical protein ACWN79_13445 [Vagococcus hydrophili]
MKIEEKFMIFIGLGSIVMGIVHAFYIKNIGLSVIFLLLGIIFLVGRKK